MSAVQINLPLEDDQTAQQVPMTAISADAAHVAVNTTDVQAGLFELAGHAKTNAMANTNLANTQRAWAKVGSSQATNGGAVLVGDDVFHTGTVKIGASTDDGTGRQLQVKDGLSVTGLSKYSNVFSGRITAPVPNQYTKICEISDYYKGIYLEIIGGTWVCINREVFAINYSPDHGVSINSLQKTFTIFGYCSIVVAQDSVGVYSVYLRTYNGDNNVMYNIHFAGDFNATKQPIFTPTVSNTAPANIVYNSETDFNSIVSEVTLSGIATARMIGINKRPTETLDVNGTVRCNTLKYFTLVNMSDGKTKNVVRPISAGMAQLFLRMFPEAFFYTYKDEYVPDDMKGKVFVGFDAQAVKAVQQKNPELFVPMTTTTVVAEFDKEGLEWAQVDGMVFEKTPDDFETDEDFEAAYGEWEAQKEAMCQGYEKKKQDHQTHKELFNGIEYLDTAAMTPMLTMAVKGLLAQVDALTLRIEALEKTVKPKRVVKKKVIK